MPPPYAAIPTLDEWKSDSFAWFALRSSDHVLLTVDSLVADYHDVNLALVQAETLYYLRSALQFWLNKINVVPQNTPPTAKNVTNLPATAKATGSTDRAATIQALLVAVNAELRGIFGVGSDPALALALVAAYQATNLGVVPDQHWLNNGGLVHSTVYLTNAGMQRMYKLRYRAGLAWRWNFNTNTYTVFDSTDNSESENDDQLVHFVMNQRGAIYAGFDRNVIWFKHSSLVGGADALAAGRLKVQQGVVTYVENDSGHYHPTFKHMVNLLQRLRLYGSNLANTRVGRHSNGTVFTAQQMLASPASWPDGAMGG